MIDTLTAMVDTLSAKRKAAPVETPFTWENLPKLSKAQISIALASSDGSGRFEIPLGEQLVVFEPTNEMQTTDEWITFEARIGNESFDVHLNSGLVQARLDDINSTQIVSDLSPTHLALVIEHLFAPFVEPLEQFFDGPLVVQVANFAKVEFADEMFVFNVSRSTENLGSIAVSSGQNVLLDFIRHISEPVRQQAKAKSLTVGHSASFRGESFTVSTEELMELRHGDGLMLPDDWSPKKLTSAVLNGRSLVPLEIVDEGLKMTENPQKITDVLEENEDRMNSKPDIEVEIAIELCRGTFKTEELLNFEKGTVLPFPTDIRSTVTLLCNEQVFATGDLVDVEGKFGVRIRDLV